MQRSEEKRRDSFKAVVESVLSSREREHWLRPADFAVLRTLLLLAAVDGEVSQGELDYFRSLIEQYRDDVGGRTREALWKSALHGAGYLILQSRFVSRDELIAAFVEEAEGDFVKVLSTSTDNDVKAAFDVPQVRDRRRYRIVRDPTLGAVVELAAKDGWTRLFSFDTAAQLPVDFEYAHWWCQTHPDSSFLSGLWVFRLHRVERRTDCRLRLQDGSGDGGICRHAPFGPEGRGPEVPFVRR